MSRGPVVLASLLAVSGCGDGERVEPPGGREMYVRYCASCHGIYGRGDGPVAPQLARPPTDLTALERQGRFDDRNLMEIIDGRRVVPVHGTREMPVWGAVFRAEAEAADGQPYRESLLRTAVLVDYLRTIQD